MQPFKITVILKGYLWEKVTSRSENCKRKKQISNSKICDFAFLSNLRMNKSRQK